MSVKWLTEQLSTQDIELTEKQQHQFQTYFQMLVEWNEKMNLTSITEELEVYLKHFYDSIALSFYTDLTQELTICDIGAGAGFPSIPLKIIYPNLKVTIVDSLNKRIHFLNQLAEALDLENVSFVHDRAEIYGKGDYRASYDIVTARAVARLSVLSELCLPLAKKGGYFIALKAQRADEEIVKAKKAIATLGAKFEEQISEMLPIEDSEREILVIRKTLETPKKYPRRPGKPAKQPL